MYVCVSLCACVRAGLHASFYHKPIDDARQLRESGLQCALICMRRSRAALSRPLVISVQLSVRSFLVCRYRDDPLHVMSEALAA